MNATLAGSDVKIGSPSGGLPTSISCLTSAVVELEQIIAQLEKRVEPLVTPSPVAKDTETVSESRYSSQYASTIGAQSKKIERMIDRIKIINCSLDI